MLNNCTETKSCYSYVNQSFAGIAKALKDDIRESYQNGGQILESDLARL